MIAEEWMCQWPGTCSYCSQCVFCTEGPMGTPGGCGHCKFCGAIACPPKECVSNEAMNRNIKGEVMILDVNSWWKHNGAEKPARITTAAQCEQLCRTTSFCNAWSFCLDPKGCGSGCNATAAGADGFSDFGPSGTCFGSLGTYETTGAYPYQMCTLKYVNDTENIEFWDNSKEWVSGVISSNSPVYHRNVQKIVEDNGSYSSQEINVRVGNLENGGSVSVMSKATTSNRSGR